MMKIELIHQIGDVRYFAVDEENIFFSSFHKLRYWNNGVAYDVKTYGDGQYIDIVRVGSFVVVGALVSTEVYDIQDRKIINTLVPASQNFHAYGDHLLRYRRKQNDTPAAFTLVNMLSAETRWELTITFTPQLNGCVNHSFFAFPDAHEQSHVYIFDAAGGYLRHQIDLIVCYRVFIPKTRAHMKYLIN